MLRQACILACASVLLADTAADIPRLFTEVGAALRNRKPAALWLLFDPSMPGYGQFRKDSAALLAQAETEVTIAILKDEGDDRARTVELDWRMEITQQERAASTTIRNATVTCKLARRDGNWRIVSFAPLDVFAPVRAGDAWDQLVSAATTLNRPDDNSPASPSWFLHSVDPAMPGIEKLRAGLNGLLRRGQVDSTLDLISNEGTDRERTLEVDWSLQVVDANTGIVALQKEKRIRIRMQWQDRRWRIAAIDPLEFFAM